MNIINLLVYSSFAKYARELGYTLTIADVDSYELLAVPVTTHAVDEPEFIELLASRSKCVLSKDYMCEPHGVMRYTLMIGNDNLNIHVVPKEGKSFAQRKQDVKNLVMGGIYRHYSTKQQVKVIALVEIRNYISAPTLNSYVMDVANTEDGGCEPIYFDKDTVFIIADDPTPVVLYQDVITLEYYLMVVDTFLQVTLLHST